MTARLPLRIRLALVLVLSFFAAGADCGGAGRCEPEQPLPGPMTPERARALAPSVTTGLAASTTQVLGDCRPRPPDDTFQLGDCDIVVNPACESTRTSLRTLVVPVNLSLPVSAACSGGFAVADLAVVAVADAASSDAGEVVIAVAPGTYRVFLSGDGRCAACGLERAAEECLVSVIRGTVATRDLVLDEATR